MNTIKERLGKAEQILMDYDINVAGDSGTAMISDITNQFIRKMW